MKDSLDVLIPTCNRPAALALTLCSLSSQTLPRFRVLLSDQSDGDEALERGELLAVVRLLEAQGRPVEFFRNLPRRGMAQQRDFLLSRSQAELVLFCDDDLLLEPHALSRLTTAISREKCGFVGAAPIGLSYADDCRRHEQAVEFWKGPVTPETVLPGTPQWNRFRLHNAANVWHLQQSLPLQKGEFYLYKVAWVGGCVLYDHEKLLSAGGFSFWKLLPEKHCGEDALAQLKVMARYGGCGVLPSGVYHQELPTTVHDRRVNAPEALRTQIIGAGVARRELASRTECSVSVVIPTRNRAELLERCLEALVGQDFDDSQYEILVVDDGDSEQTRKLIDRVSTGTDVQLSCLSTAGAQGPAAARNIGWRAAQGRIIAFTDDDCIPTRGWLSAIAHACDSITAAGGWGRIVVPRGRSITDYVREVAKLERCEFVTANCFCSREALEKVGGFDERFRRAWREDSDLYFSLLSAGLRLRRIPEAVVLHPARKANWGVSIGEQSKSCFNALLYKKHPLLYREKIENAPPLLYYAIVISLFIAASAGIGGQPFAAATFGGAWFALVIYLTFRRLNSLECTLPHLLEMVATSAVIPPLSVFWRLWGALRFRVVFG